MVHASPTGRAPVLLALVALTACLAAASAAAQTSTPFVPLQAPYVDAAGDGVFITDVGGTRWVQVETDSVPGMTPADHAFPFPVAVEQGISLDPPNTELSPDRRWLVFWGTRSDGVPGVKIYVYRIPAASGALLEPLVTGRNMAGRDQSGFFVDAAPGGRHIYCFVESEVSFQQKLHWVDLDTGVSAWSFGIGTGVGWPIMTSPDGVAAFVRTDGAFAGQATYNLIELCTDDLGVVATPSGGPWNDLPGPAAQAFLLDDGVELWAQVHHDGTVFPAVPLDDCSGAPPVTGACCVDWTCVDGVTQAVCETELGGTWQGDGSTCAGAGCPTPPEPVLELAITGPATMPAATPTTFHASYANTGSAPATGVQVVATMPAAATFVSAGGGGVYDPGTRRVTWLVGDVPDGAAGDLPFTLETTCQTTLVQFVQAYVISTNAPLAFAAPVDVTVQPASTAPLTATLVRTLPQGEPLADGDTVVFDLIMTNGEPEARTLNTSFTLGNPLQVDAILDDAGGAASHDMWRVNWSGVLEPMQTRTLSVRGVLPACRPGFLTETRLNEGNPVAVRNACGVAVAQVAGDTTALAPPALVTRLEVAAQGTTRVIGAASGWLDARLARPGGPVTVRWVLTNTSAATADVGGASCSLGALDPAADPPFTGPTPPGAVWDAAANAASWSGLIAAGDSVVVRMDALFPTAGVCRTTVGASASLAGCGQVMSTASRAVLGLAEPWADAHLVSLTAWGDLDRFRPGTDAALDPWFCTGVETLHDLSPVGDGAYWLAGLPTLRVDPAALDVAELAPQPGLDMHNITCVVEDTTAHALYLGGNEYLGGQPHLRLRRLDLATLQVDDVLNETSPTRTWSMPLRLRLDGQGRLVMTSQMGGLTRLDPADSTTVEDLSAPDSLAYYHDVSLLDDGRYLLPEFAFGGFGLPRRLAAVDPADGSYEILGDLDAGPWSSDQPPVAAAQGDSGRVYLAFLSSSVAVMDLTASPPALAGVPGFPVKSYVGLAFVPGATSTAVEDPSAPPPSLRTLFAGAAPNPFNPRTELRFELADGGPVRLEIYDVQGRRVRTLLDARLPAGRHGIAWQGRDDDGRALPSGLYLARLVAGDLQRSAKLMLTR